MKVAIVYNRDSEAVINLFGVPNREKIGLQTIRRIADALRSGGHSVATFEGDKDLIDKLEGFMPRVLKGERPGLAFNVSYGIQGQARYTHVPSILEMVGIPYVGSGPLAHSLALDKVVSKMIFRQNGLPTPDFAILKDPNFEIPDLEFPLIVKPKNEAVSFGIRIVEDERELREAAQSIFDEFSQPVLAEQYIEGREINVGILGNSPPEALPPVELTFGEGPAIYTYEDKTRKSGREIGFKAPAPIGDELTERAQRISQDAFLSLGCYDCARVDMRLDSGGNLYLLEINSLPSMGEHGSYVVGAEMVGLDFAGLVNRLVEVASARYFGTPHPPELATAPKSAPESIFSFVTSRRDRLERRVERWVGIPSRTHDQVGVRMIATELEEICDEMAMRPVEDLRDGKVVWTWETKKGLEGGTLLVGHLDVPLDPEISYHGFHRDPEWLQGEGAGCSRGPLAVMEFALRSLRAQRQLRRQPIGMLLYADEGRDCEYSRETIRKAVERAGRVLVMRPGNAGGQLVLRRRGLRKYRLVIEGEPRRLGAAGRRSETPRKVFGLLESYAALSSRKERVAVTAVDLKTEALPMMYPHRLGATILLSYPEPGRADEVEKHMRELLAEAGLRYEFDLISDRPALVDSGSSRRLARSIVGVAKRWEIPAGTGSSVWPSVAGAIADSTPVVCGVGPVAQHLYTPNEAVQRISLLQRTMLLAQFLAKDIEP